MPAYYLETQREKAGHHKIHQEGCSRLPARATLLYLGEYESCHRALIEAERHYPNCRGCRDCTKECCYD